MLFDDRLATVLRADIRGERAARTQFRQLLDLLGTDSAQDSGEIPTAAYARLGELCALIPADEQSRILREPGLRLRNPRLVAVLAEGDSQPAAAALATARLSEQDWLRLIPRLPMVARGFLRHRRDLPPGAKEVLDRLGVRDRVLSGPPGSIAPAPATEESPLSAPAVAQRPPERDSGEDRDGIKALLRRIEAFREGRSSSSPAPRLPLGDHDDGSPVPGSLETFEFTSNPEGRITWASADHAPSVVGLDLCAPPPCAVAVMDEAGARAMRTYQPLRAAPLTMNTPGDMAGEWRIDAEPTFTRESGSFTGYRGRIRRPVYDTGDDSATRDTPADRMRQLLHELRTPVGAIQGFAEIIQQQLFGPAPNEYRAYAAAIAVDAAKLLAGFDEIDRLARLETGATSMSDGESDMREIVVETIRRLDGALRARNSGFALDVSGSPFSVAIPRDETLLLAWRILASLAGSLAPSETCLLSIAGDGHAVRLAVDLPQAIAAQDDPLAGGLPAKRPAISAGMFGTGFSLRLARAEVLAAGGAFAIADGRLTVVLPVLTGAGAVSSKHEVADRAAGD